MMRGTVAALVAAVVVGSWTPARADDQPRDLEQFAVLGLEDVTLHAGAEVESGNVAATRGTVRLARHARVAGTVLGDTIEVGGGGRVGPLFCHFVQGPAALGCATLTDPVANIGKLSLVRVAPGAADVHVPTRATSAPLAPGAYGAVTVDPRSRLVLAGGAYDVLSLDVAHRGQVQCKAKCTLRVRERVRLGRRSTIAIAAPLDARAVSIQVESRDPRPVFAAAADVTLAGTVYAPNGDIVLGSRGNYVGAFVAQTVTIGRRSRIRLLSAF